MSARIFISYRSADGMDKATALARDLGAVFGPDTVFLDKDDLPGGSSWRQEIGRALQERPVLLLLMTPQLLEATAEDGRLRIAEPADPVRRELEAALEAGAHVIPVLCDGLQAPPDATRLPAPFNRIGELTWRKLRAYDWAHDVERLIVDLKAAGVQAGRPAPPLEVTEPHQVEGATAPARAAPTTHSSRWLGGAAVALVLLALAGWWWKASRPVTAVSPAPTATTTAPSLSGRWAATLSRGERVALVFTQAGSELRFASEPITITERADWAEYRSFWRERFGAELERVMYRGEGLLHTDPGQPAAVDIALKLYGVPGNGEPVDSGNLSATLSADGRVLTGTLWLNSLQAEQPARLERDTAAR